MVWPSRCAARITKGRGESARPLGPAPAFGSKMLAYSSEPAVSRSMMPKAPRSVLPALPGGKYSDPAARKWKRSRMRARVTASLCESGGVHLYGTRKDTLHESVRLMPVTPVRSVLKISTADPASPELGHYKQTILFTLVGQTIVFRGLPPLRSAGRRHKPIVCPTEGP